MKQIPLSLYIHVPWCEKKCPYCDFNSHMARAEVDERGYVIELLRDLDSDIEKYAEIITQREIKTVFIGGGTPSLFSAESYQRLFDGLRARLNFSNDIEITLEANPGSSEADKFKGFRKAGINRLSIGVQSFNQEHLSALGRVHNSQEALNAASYAREAGFDNFNLDLMFGLPQQSLQQSLADVQQALALSPSHLSCYQLTIEPNTLFHHNPPITPGDELLWDMQEQLQAELATNGYSQYEVSAYSQAGRQCQHNLNYWQFGDYLGIGAGAHSKLTLANGDVSRAWKIKHPNTYIARANKVGADETVLTQQLPFEFMMNALRLNNGFEIDTFTSRCNLSQQTIQPLLDKHQSEGLIEIEPNRIRPTTFGHNMVNNMLQDYLSLGE
ncbi:MAG: putative oxygen-independent coproporphyrinogen III oxidase [Arenicella sp.]|jgi:putative oxygen-independent coproporphyrinogen III oxidase